MVIDLFDPQLPVLAQKTVNPGEQSLLYVVGRVPNKKQPQVLASASRIYEEKSQTGSYSFVAKSPAKTLNSVRVLLPAQPKETKLTDSAGQCAVACRRPNGNSLKLSPDAVLKRRSRRIQRDRELTPFAAKILVELGANRINHRRIARLELARDRPTHPLELRAE